MKGRSSLPHLTRRSCWLVRHSLRPVRPDCANHMNDGAERHYTEECQQT